MADDAGTLYVLTNPVMPGLVKIGFTKGSVKKRVEEISRPTGMPVAFECYFAAKVPSFVEKEGMLHKIFFKDRVNINREFFRVDPERVVLAIKMGPHEIVTPGKPTLDPQEQKALTKAKKHESNKQARFTFASVGIPVGSLLTFTRDPSIQATVEEGNEIQYEGQPRSITLAAKLALRKVGINWKSVRGPAFWLYNGKTLNEWREAAGG